MASAVAVGAISSPRAWAQAGQSISRSTVYDVAIIGAGAAGIAAAHAFAGTGARVIVLEARGRPGGRIVTNSQALGMPFDVGASYIHNAPINPIMALAAALLQRLAAVRGRLSLCADQAAAAKWWLSMPMASVSAEGPMPKALSTRRTSPLMPGCRHQGRACPLRRARMTSNPLIVA